MPSNLGQLRIAYLYHALSGSEIVRVMFPIDPEDFFIADSAEGNGWARLFSERSSIDKGKLSGRAGINHLERIGVQGIA